MKTTIRAVILILLVLLSRDISAQEYVTTLHIPALRLSDKPLLYADPIFNIGRLTLRYDIDSSYLRIGFFGNPTGLGNLRIGKEFNGQLFDFNPSQFSWSPTSGLNLNFTQDSINSSMYTNKKDTSWVQLGETLTRVKFFTLKKPHYGGGYPFLDWKWYYGSIDENGTVTRIDSNHVLNYVKYVDNVGSIAFSGATLTPVDSVYLEPGTWDITFGFSILREKLDLSSNSATGDGVTDSVECVFNKGAGVGNRIKDQLYDIYTYPQGIISNKQSFLEWKAGITLTAGTWVYLAVRSWVVETSLIHYITRWNIKAFLVK